MTSILNVKDEPIFDDRIVKIETHTYNPFANTTFEHSDEIRIPIQQQDLYTLPSESFLYIEGKLTIKKPAEGSDVTLGNNCIAFMFDEIRYELDGVEIDRNRNVGITSSLKNYVTMSSDRSVIARNAGWDPWNLPNGYFNFCVPLNMLLGFYEDYRRVVINARHELILIRARNDNNCLVGSVRVSAIATHNPTFVGHKTATQLEKPRYIIFALQAGRKNVMLEDASRFDHYKLTNVKLYLNSECYPYDDMNLDFEKNKWSILYDTYTRFCKTYYGYDYLEPNQTVTTFRQKGPFVIIDCSRQNESVKSATVDVRLKFECKENVPASTTAYCLIIHDRVVQYNPLTNVVRKIT
ncbi:uncharacterized protein LOC118646927 [Monomorium pharaonis]|uniref:uncharacterized protein LOC118646927 n=1 Tax=Monomorium pharaonis TaxID=307658 RepID=UPI001746BF0D|nr:uncharacterized protein LOC118646927 [Monomorium pharaonis]